MNIVQRVVNCDDFNITNCFVTNHDSVFWGAKGIYPCMVLSFYLILFEIQQLSYM